MPIIAALTRCKQEDQEIKVILTAKQAGVQPGHKRLNSKEIHTQVKKKRKKKRDLAAELRVWFGW